MSKILSQEEIDALLSTVGRPKGVKVEDDVDQVSAQLYDFKHPERISKEQLRTLRTIHDNFARMFATYLSTTLRALVDVFLVSIDQVTFSEYALSLAVPSSLYILDLQKLDGKAILEVSPQFLLFVVDRMLGGIGDTDIEPREVTIIEQNVVRKIIDTVINYLNEVWKHIHPLEAKFDSFEADPQFVQIARSSESMAVIFFEIRVRGVAFAMNFGLPYFVLEPIMNRLSAQSMMAITALAGRRLREGEKEELQERIFASRLSVRANLAETNFSIRDFMNLNVNDLLHLEKRTHELLQVEVGGKLKFLGEPGQLGRYRAIKISRSISPIEELIYE